MKNLFPLPTDKPSRLVKLKLFGKDKYNLSKEILPIQDEEQYQNIYITSTEEIKVGDWYLEQKSKFNPRKLISDKWGDGQHFKTFNQEGYKKIILTTDQDLIADGVQAINDEFLEWFVKNPSCNEVNVVDDWNSPRIDAYEYKIIIPKEEPNPYTQDDYFNDEFFKKEEQTKCYCGPEELKQETLEEVAERIFKTHSNNTSLAEGHYDYMMDKEDFKEAFLEITKLQQERSYSEEEVTIMLNKFGNNVYGNYTRNEMMCDFVEQWFEQFKNK